MWLVTAKRASVFVRDKDKYRESFLNELERSMDAGFKNNKVRPISYDNRFPDITVKGGTLEGFRPYEKEPYILSYGTLDDGKTPFYVLCCAVEEL